MSLSLRLYLLYAFFLIVLQARPRDRRERHVGPYDKKNRANIRAVNIVPAVPFGL